MEKSTSHNKYAVELMEKGIFTNIDTTQERERNSEGEMRKICL